MKQKLIFDVSPLMDLSIGSRELYSFDGDIAFEDLDTKSAVSGKMEIMKIEDGFNAKATDVHVKIEFTCSRCLEKYIEEVFIDMMERQFLMDAPEKIEDPNDVFLVNRKNSDIDLTEPLRQEIILHFPLIPVCSKGCKGICPSCGKNRNRNKCNCIIEEPQPVKPLSALKDLFKN